MKPLNIEKILLLFPRSIESRWESFSIPPSILFLTGGLERENFKVDFSYLEVPSLSLSTPRKLADYNLIGISLFDDFFLEIKEFSENIPGNVLLALGGITPTMAPFETFSLIERANIIFRGEGEKEFPILLQFLRKGEIPETKGWALRINGETFLSLNRVVRKDLSDTPISFSPFSKENLAKGLELVVSRGCPRSCIFCTHVHGKVQRKTPPEEFRKWLREFGELGGQKILNLADDDILLDPDYAGKIFMIAKEEGFKLWGIQTSMDSLLNPKALSSIKIAEFVSKPLLWIGTDAFLSSRAKRLGKKAGEKEIGEIVSILEKEGIENYHYWILSDCLSTLEEFTEEFLFVSSLLYKNERFHLLPNSPFLIPYPYTPSYIRAIRQCKDRITFKRRLRKNEIQYPLVLYERPRSWVLSNLLNPKQSFIPWVKPGEFLELVKEGKFERAASILVSILREEGLDPTKFRRKFERVLSSQPVIKKTNVFMKRKKALI